MCIRDSRLLPVCAGHGLRQARADGCDKAFYPRYGVVAGEIGEAQPPAGDEDTGDLREDEPRRERVEVLRTDDPVELLRIERHRLGLRHDAAEVGAVVDESSKSGGFTVQDGYGVALLADGRGVRPGCAQHQYALGLRAHEPRHRGLRKEGSGHDRMLTTRCLVRRDLRGGSCGQLWDRGYPQPVSYTHLTL